MAICAAMRWEFRPVLQALQSVRRARSGPKGVWMAEADGCPVIVFRTGIGPVRAAAATRGVLDSYAVRCVVNTGCAGALVPDLPVGRLVIPSRLLDADGVDEEHRVGSLCLALMREAASRSNGGNDAGPLLTSPVPLVTADAKRAAHARFAATAVEMEGAAVAREAQARGIRFAAVRSILDTLVTDLPEPGRDGSSLGALRRGLVHLRRSGDGVPALGLAGAALSVHTALRVFFAEFLHDVSKLDALS